MNSSKKLKINQNDWGASAPFSFPEKFLAQQKVLRESKGITTCKA